MTLLPITDDGSVPVYDCHVILSPPNEQGQIVAGRTLPFDDLGVARAAIAQREAVSP